MTKAAKRDAAELTVDITEEKKRNHDACGRGDIYGKARRRKLRWSSCSFPSIAKVALLVADGRAGAPDSPPALSLSALLFFAIICSFPPNICFAEISPQKPI